MSSIVAILLVSSLTICTQAQTWVGNYTIDSSACDPSVCCCPQGTLVVSRPLASTLAVSCAVNGTLCASLSSIAELAAYPTGYQSTFNTSGAMVEIGLSPDSKVINVTVTFFFTCTATGIKIKQAVSAASMTSTDVVFSMLLLGALTNKIKK